MLACIRMYLLGTLPSAGVLGGIPLGQYVPNLLVLNNYSMLSRLAHAYILGSRGPIPKLHCLSTCMLTISNNYPEQIHIEKCIDSNQPKITQWAFHRPFIPSVYSSSTNQTSLYSFRVHGDGIDLPNIISNLKNFGVSIFSPISPDVNWKKSHNWIHTKNSFCPYFKQVHLSAVSSDIVLDPLHFN